MKRNVVSKARLMAAGAAILFPVAVPAQQAPRPSPTPAPFFLPGANGFRLGPAPAPRPTPTPRPSPSASATPRRPAGVPGARPTPAPAARATPAVRATPSPAARATSPPQSAATPTPRATAAPTPTPTPSATSVPAPRVAPPNARAAPGAAATPAARPAPPPQPGFALPDWALPAAGGALATVMLGLALLLAGRRRRSVAEAQAPQHDEAPPGPPQAVAPPRVPAAPLRPLPPIKSRIPIRPAAPSPAPPAPPALPVDEPFRVELRPGGIAFEAQQVSIAFEIALTNAQPEPAEAVRVVLNGIAANPAQDRAIAAFHARSGVAPVAPPFDLPPGKAARLSGRLLLPRSDIHVVQVGGRPMFVPLVLVDVRWRGGLSVRHFAADFMLGTASGEGVRLGPIWLDRPPPRGPLSATRYLVGSAPVRAA